MRIVTLTGDAIRLVLRSELLDRLAGAEDRDLVGLCREIRAVQAEIEATGSVVADDDLDDLSHRRQARRAAPTD